MRNLKICNIKFRIIIAAILALILVMTAAGFCYADEENESGSSIMDLFSGLMSGEEDGMDSNALNDILSVIESVDESDISEEQAMELFLTLFGAFGDSSGMSAYIPSYEWKISEDDNGYLLPEDIRSFFEQAVKGYTGMGFTPIALLESQIVAGMNYRILAFGEPILPESDRELDIVTLYCDLDGNCEITDVSDFDLNIVYGLIGQDLSDVTLAGGWSVPEEDVEADVPEKIKMEIADYVSDKTQGNTYLPQAVLAGTTNDDGMFEEAVLCRVYPGDEGGKIRYAVIFAAVDDGTAIYREAPLDLEKIMNPQTDLSSGDALDFSDLFSFTEAETETLSAEELNENLEKAAAYIESVFDVSGMISDTYDDNEDAGYISRSWYFEEPENIELSDEFEVDGNKFIINKTLEKDIEAMDFEIHKYEETVDPGTAESISISKNDKNFIIDLESNDTDDVMDIGDLHVTGFSSEYFLYSLPFEYCGITGDSSLEDIVRILGNPNYGIDLSVDSDNPTFTLYYGNEGSNEDMNTSFSLCIYCEYNPDDNTATVTNISLSYYTYPVE